MSAENIVSLQGARVDRDARIRSRIDEMIAKAGADMEQWGEALINWTFLPKEDRAQVADSLAGEIATRYAPIAKQFKNALHDALVLYVAGAQERGEDLGIGLLRGLMLVMHDARYIEIAKHFVTEEAARRVDAASLEAGREYRRKNPTPITAACDGLFDAYVASRKK